MKRRCGRLSKGHDLEAPPTAGNSEPIGPSLPPWIEANTDSQGFQKESSPFWADVTESMRLANYSLRIFSVSFLDEDWV